MTDLEDAWREEWGRLLALLVAQFRRLDLAEDGLGDAFATAADRWRRDGTPDNPAAWLLTAARRRIYDRLRSEAIARRKLPLLQVDAALTEEARTVMADAGETVVDERLRLVLLCAHPALAPEHAAALTLRLVLGVSTADIARLFLVPTATMAARLTRARKALADQRFEVPSGAALEARVTTVEEVAYLAFTSGYAPGSGPDLLRADLAGEAIRLVRVLRSVLPAGFAGAADLDALLALMLLQHARRDARVDDGRLVLLPDQDRSRWRHDEISEALELLAPLVGARSTPYLLQALIAAEHAIAATAADDGLDPDRRLVRRAGAADRLTRGAAQPGGGRGRGRRARRGAAAARRARAPRSPAARGAGRAAGPGGPARGGADGVRGRDRAVRQRGGARPPERAPRPLVPRSVHALHAGDESASRSWLAETLTPSMNPSPVTSRTAAASLTTWSRIRSPEAHDQTVLLGHGDEQVRWYRSPVAVPPGQGLGADDPAGWSLDDGLVDDRDLVVDQGLAQVLHHLQPLQRGLVLWRTRSGRQRSLPRAFASYIARSASPQERPPRWRPRSPYATPTLAPSGTC